MKEQIIQIPDTFEVKEIKDGKIILVEKEKKLTYENIRDKELPKQFFIKNDIECTTSRQYYKLLAINKLINLAKWLNNGWQPDWKNINEVKYTIGCDYDSNRITFNITSILYNWSIVYFKSEELAKQAVKILGEKTIRLALCTDY